MNEKVWLLLFIMLPLVAFSACAHDSPSTNAPANAPNAVANANANAAKPAPKSPLEGIVSASVERVEMSAGATTETGVRLLITNGYHVNANPATEKFLIPTSLEIKPEAGITVENIVYPKSLKRKFPFAEAPLDVYEGDVLIKFSVRAPRDIAAGQHTLRARVRVQPCDDEKCYPPSTIETSLPVTIR